MFLGGGYDQPGQPDEAYVPYHDEKGPETQNYTGQPQIQAVYTMPDTPINSHLCLSIFVCICCCWPLGIAAIVFAVRANDEKAVGNWEAARQSSAAALRFSIVAFVFGTIILTVSIALAATGNFTGWIMYTVCYAHVTVTTAYCSQWNNNKIIEIHLSSIH